MTSQLLTNKGGYRSITLAATRTPTGDRIVGRNVAAAREQRGWTQAELASNVGYSLAWVRKVEQAERGINTHQIRHLAQALRVSSSFLLGETAVLAPPLRSTALEEVPNADRDQARELLRFQRRVGARWRGPDSGDDRQDRVSITQDIRYADPQDERVEASTDRRRGAVGAVQSQPAAPRRRFRRLR